MEASTKIQCPKCSSDQITANQKGFSGGKALVGDLLLGPVGMLAGTSGKNKIIITCLSCGHPFSPGQDKASVLRRRQDADASVAQFKELVKKFLGLQLRYQIGIIAAAGLTLYFLFR